MIKMKLSSISKDLLVIPEAVSTSSIIEQHGQILGDIKEIPKDKPINENTPNSHFLLLQHFKSLRTILL